MAILKVESFSGIAPLVDPKKLPESGAQHADNCIFEGGDLRPLAAALEVAWGGTAPANVDRLHQWKERWLAWTGNVDVVNSPVINDQWERVYWSRGAGSRPRFAINNTLQAAVNMTALGEDLGVIGPQSAPAVIPSELLEPSISAETMALTSPVRVTTAIDHPFDNGQRVIVTLAKRDGAPSSVSATPPDRTGMVEATGKTYVIRLVKTDAGITDLRQFDLIGADGTGFSAYQPNNWVATIKRLFSDQDQDSRAYVYTFVSQYGEESQPSPPSPTADVLIDSAVTVQLQVGAEHIAAGYRARLYRSVTGTAGTNFQFIKEAPVAAGLQIVDDIDAVSLGELLPSETWTPPPVGLTGLVTMPGGFLAGFVGNTVYFSEPYMPHAWPLQYRRTTQDAIVGLGVYGQTLVVATRGKPYLGAGADPASVSLAQVDYYAPCLSKNCISASGTGVIYPSLDGLVHVSAEGVRPLTQNHFSKKQWEAMWTTPRAAIWHDGRYLVGLADAIWIFEPHGSGIHISRAYAGSGARAFAINNNPSAANPGLPRDTLHFVAPTGTALYAFNRGTPLQATWVGRIATLPRPVSFSCAQVYASQYPVTLSLHAAQIPANGTEPRSLAYPAGDLVQAFTVAGPEPFRLPGMFMAREWRIDIQSTAALQSAYLATSMDEIKQL